MIVHQALAMGIIIYLYVCNASVHAQTCPCSSWYENEFASHLRILISSYYPDSLAKLYAHSTVCSVDDAVEEPCA